MQRETVKKRIFYFFLAILVNGLILMMVLQLSSGKNKKSRSDSYNPIFLANYRTPPQPATVRPVKKTEPEKKPLEKIPKVSVKQKKVVAKQPDMNFKMPEMNFEINPLLSTGMTIAPPPVPEVKPKPEPEPAEVSQPAPEPAPVQKEFGTDDVDQKPMILKKVEPIYPNRARRRNIKGKVTVKFLVSSSGHVTRPSIVKATPKGFFEQSVLQAVRKWLFKPGYYQGRPVATWVVLPIQFNLSG